jgi:hypothetical protein
MPRASPIRGPGFALGREIASRNPVAGGKEKSMNPESRPTTDAGATADMKKGLIRVAFPAEQIARARELGKPEHANVAQIARRALQKELDLMRRQQSSESPRRQKNR